ncbi:hypothetical protein M885DRAFT_515961 [Pelagophyceae sp. CCMP2097]|nr:hypothetical protein M885DRAFT_515961 [Pelagophyceae sp. CCMP2097]
MALHRRPAPRDVAAAASAAVDSSGPRDGPEVPFGGPSRVPLEWPFSMRRGAAPFFSRFQRRSRRCQHRTHGPPGGVGPLRARPKERICSPPRVNRPLSCQPPLSDGGVRPRPTSAGHLRGPKTREDVCGAALGDGRALGDIRPVSGAASAALRPPTRPAAARKKTDAKTDQTDQTDRLCISQSFLPRGPAFAAAMAS